MILVIVKGKDGIEERFDFTDEQMEEASKWQRRLELEYSPSYTFRDECFCEVVLLQAPTIEDMRRTHGRFFKKE